MKEGRKAAAKAAATVKADAKVTLDWSGLATTLRGDYSELWAESAQDALDDLGSDVLFDQVNELALAFAEERAAELVTGIEETTRESLQSLISRALEEGLSPSDLAAEIADGYLFSEARAETIAETELAMAQSEGALAGWKESGVVSGKEWLLASEHDAPDDECDSNADDGVIDLEDDFSSGDAVPPAHPRCKCSAAATIDESLLGDDSEGE